MRNLPSITILVVLWLTVSGCGSPRLQTDLVWAVNVGGPAHIGADGTNYRAEESVTGGDIRRLATVKGSQDPLIYRTYRQGAIEVAHPIDSGTYDITFYFAEPEQLKGGERIFDAIVEGRRVIDDLDVMAARDGKIESALTVSIPNIAVLDGELNIAFEASANEPVLSALAVRGARPETSWTLAWSDEFDGSGLPDPANWNIERWPARKVNDEDQAYTARTKNLRVEDGKLIIEAHREDYQGAAYTSGRVQSSGKGDFLYGRAEVRAKLPAGRGTWAAIWMLPSDPFRYATKCKTDEDWQGNPDCDAWPNSGEIDIMEHVGYQMGHIHGTVHNKAYYWINWEQRKGRILVDDIADAWHVYAMEWTPERIDILLDDTLYFTYVNENAGWESWPFDHAFHIVLNFAVGGYWGRAGGGIDESIFPQRMAVDYVRIYEQDGD